jgi:hypothetical protein
VLAGLLDVVVAFGDGGEHGLEVLDRQLVEPDVSEVGFEVHADVVGVVAAGGGGQVAPAG